MRWHASVPHARTQGAAPAQTTTHGAGQHCCRQLLWEWVGLNAREQVTDSTSVAASALAPALQSSPTTNQCQDAHTPRHLKEHTHQSEQCRNSSSSAPPPARAGAPFVCVPKRGVHATAQLRKPLARSSPPSDKRYPHVRQGKEPSLTPPGTAAATPSDMCLHIRQSRCQRRQHPASAAPAPACCAAASWVQHVEQQPGQADSLRSSCWSSCCCCGCAGGLVSCCCQVEADAPACVGVLGGGPRVAVNHHVHKLQLGQQAAADAVTKTKAQQQSVSLGHCLHALPAPPKPLQHSRTARHTTHTLFSTSALP
jgi:hypothetical protein